MSNGMNRTQISLLARHMRINKNISGVEAAALYKVRSLTKQICNLKKLGYKIEGRWHTDPTGQRYKRYYLVEGKAHA